MNHIPRTARASIRQAPETWNRWLSICSAVEADDDIPADEFAAFFEKFNTLQRLGVSFDDAFVLRVRELQALLINTEDDQFLDGADHGVTDEIGVGEALPGKRRPLTWSGTSVGNLVSQHPPHRRVKVLMRQVKRFTIILQLGVSEIGELMRSETYGL